MSVDTQVINMLKFRGAWADFELVPINNCSQALAASILRDSLLFLSFGPAEGFALPPAEAMAGGCMVIGYHGRGGREYFHEEYSYPVETGDIVGFARTVEQVLEQYCENPLAFKQKQDRAAAYIREHYSTAQEERDIVECWQAILEMPPQAIRPSLPSVRFPTESKLDGTELASIVILCCNEFAGLGFQTLSE